MPTPTSVAIENLVQPMLLGPLPAEAWDKLADYTALLFRWNRRMNLTAVRDPEVFARLHLGECLRLAQTLPPEIGTLLDYGSGAGLPGIPIQIARPEIRVALAESHGKKAAYLREAMRTLELAGCEVLEGRAEESARGRAWDAVTLRAVDKMPEALRQAVRLLRPGGWFAALTTRSAKVPVQKALAEIAWRPDMPVPGTAQRIILIGQMATVTRHP